MPIMSWDKWELQTSPALASDFWQQHKFKRSLALKFQGWQIRSTYELFTEQTGDNRQNILISYLLPSIKLKELPVDHIKKCVISRYLY